jgi:hypothetical protein
MTRLQSKVLVALVLAFGAFATSACMPPGPCGGFHHF